MLFEMWNRLIGKRLSMRYYQRPYVVHPKHPMVTEMPLKSDNRLTGKWLSMSCYRRL
jgi:hypothetical protein